MRERPNLHIYNLYGYLQALARLCGPQYQFGVSSWEASSSIDDLATELTALWNQGDDYLPPSDFIYLGNEEIAYAQLLKELIYYLSNGCLARGVIAGDKVYSEVGRQILWDILEFYGLASTSLNEAGVFNPLVAGPVYRLKLQCSEQIESFYFLVRIEDMYVLTYLCKTQAAPNET